MEHKIIGVATVEQQENLNAVELKTWKEGALCFVSATPTPPSAFRCSLT